MLLSNDLPLTVAVSGAEELRIDLQYWTGAFRPGVVPDLLTSFATILASIAENPHRPLGQLPYLSSTQQQRLQEAACGPVEPEACRLLLHQGFEEMARTSPDRAALKWEGGKLLYGELDRQATACAAELRRQGVGDEEPIAILLERSAAGLVAILGILKAGAAFLPLDPAHPDVALKRILSSAQTRFCFCARTLADRVSALGVRPLTMDATLRDPGNSVPPRQPIRPEQLAYLISTSGTTGEPKIVEVEHRAAANTLHHSVTRLYGPGDLDLVPWSDSPAGDSGVHQIFAALTHGGTLAPIATLTELRDSPWFHDFTAYGATPSVLESLLAGSGLPPRLKAILFGGEAYPDTLPASLAAKTMVERAVNVYGPTEASIYCVADDVMTHGPGHAKGNVIGRPITNFRVDLLDENMQPVIPGTLGELFLSGIGLARGYRNDPQRTQERFPQTAGKDGLMQRFYRSGDLGLLLPDGRIEFHGRIDRQVKIAGVRIELEAVERRLEALPSVQRALVNFHLDSRGKKQLTAWLLPHKGIVLDLQATRSLAAEQLQPEMVPKLLIAIDEIPLTLAGKPDFAALAASAARMEREDTVSRPIESPNAAFSPLETLIAEEWAEVLKHRNFGLHDDFFEAGGDSLAAMELLLCLGQRLGRGISGDSLKDRWTVAGISEAVLSAPPIESFRLLGADREGTPIFWLMPNFVDFELFEGLDIPRPVYLIGTDRMEASKESFSQFADRVIARILPIQPQGPYLLGGFCFGCLAAFEIATRLHQAGAQVDRLVLVDRFGPTRTYYTLLRMKELYSRHVLGGRPRQVAKRAVARPWNRDWMVFTPGYAWRDRLARRYRPARLSCPQVTVIETSHTTWRFLIGFLPYCGWRPLVKGKLDAERDPALSAAGGIQHALLKLADANS